MKCDSQMPLLRQILVLAFPIVLENLLQALLGTVDIWFAGQLDDTAIAAIGATTLVVNLFLTAYAAVGIGAGAMIARYVGEGDQTKAGHAAGQAIWASAALGLVVGLAALWFQDPLLTLSGAEEAVKQAAVPYYRVVAVPSGFACLVLVLSACLRATKDTVTPMLVSGGANLLNILLDGLFLSWGMGLFGLALATTLSRAAAACVLLLRLFRNKHGLCLSRASLCPRRDLFLSLLRVALPAGAERLIMRAGQLVYNNLIFTISTNAYVAHSVAGTIETYAYIPAFGFASAAATLVGVSLGEGDPDKARKLTWYTWLCADAVMIPIGIVFFLFGTPLAAQFTETADVQRQVGLVLGLIAFFQPILAFSNVFSGALQGAGDTRFTMYTTLLCTWVVHIGLGSLLAFRFGMGLLGIWIGYAMNNAVRSVLLFFRFRSGAWTKVKF